MNRNIIIFVIILIILAGVGYFYLIPRTSLTEQISQQKTDNQTETPKTSKLDESIFKNLETDIVTVVFSDSTTGPQAKEILTSNELTNNSLGAALDDVNYTGWLTGARIHIKDSIKTAQVVAEKVKTFEKVYSAEEHKLDLVIQSLYPEREKYYVDVEFVDGVGQNEAKSELNKINQSRLSTMLNNPTLKEISSRTEIFEPRKDINITIKNLTSKKAYSVCQQLLSNEKVISCAPLPLLN